MIDKMVEHSRREKLSRRRKSNKLTQILKQGGDEATVAARSMIDKMVKHGLADLHLSNKPLFNLMLKFCNSSGEMREVIDVTMAKVKLKPNVVTYNTLIGTLRMEGDDAAAKSVVEEMKKAGVEPNVYTQNILNLPSRGEDLSRKRTSKLSQFLKQGGDEATVAARSMMDKMVEHGVANLHLFNLMLKFCKSSGEMREVIDVMMAKAKLKPDVVTYNTLVGGLRMEGDDAAAESVVEEMKKAGVEPDERTLEILNLPSRGEELSRKRNSKLSQFLKQGGNEATVAAWSMMAKMVEHGVANLHLFNLMLKFCKSSGEMREVIDVMMAKAKLKPDVVTYTMLVSRLRMEGDDAAAESVVEEMKKAGVEPNERTLEILNLPSQGEILGRMRTGLIRGLLQQGRESEKAAAMVCRDLHERRLMQGTIILQIMIDHCVNSDFEWPVAADEGALMWYYYMRKSKKRLRNPRRAQRADAQPGSDRFAQLHSRAGFRHAGPSFAAFAVEVDRG